MKSQIATSSESWGGKRKPPYAFTEHGVLQVANLINTELANLVSIFVIRAFIAMRETIITQQAVITEKSGLADNNPDLLPATQTKDDKKFKKF